MRWIGLIAVALAILRGQPALATEADELVGVWQQIATNAGACPTCQIEFRAKNGLSVLSNNGWTGSLTGFQGRDVIGSGRWDNHGKAWTAGRPFTLNFHLEGDRLVMMMAVDVDTPQKRIVRGTYRRAWQGM